MDLAADTVRIFTQQINLISFNISGSRYDRCYLSAGTGRRRTVFLPNLHKPGPGETKPTLLSPDSAQCPGGRDLGDLGDLGGRSDFKGRI